MVTDLNSEWKNLELLKKKLQSTPDFSKQPSAIP